MTLLAIRLDKFIIKFDDEKIKYRTYEEKDYKGIIFVAGEWTYDLIHNLAMGPRLLINSTKFECKDVPFKEATFDLLPEGVSASLK